MNCRGDQSLLCHKVEFHIESVIGCIVNYLQLPDNDVIGYKATPLLRQHYTASGVHGYEFKLLDGLLIF